MVFVGDGEFEAVDDVGHARRLLSGPVHQHGLVCRLDLTGQGDDTIGGAYLDREFAACGRRSIALTIRRVSGWASNAGVPPPPEAWTAPYNRRAQPLMAAVRVPRHLMDRAWEPGEGGVELPQVPRGRGRV